MLTPGTKLGPYEIAAPLGAGGMGEVYRARDTRLNRTVAIKVLPMHLADRPELRERFEREARSIASLNHPHICTLYDVGREGGTDYLVMEYLEGETLAARLAKGPLPLEQVLQYATEIADALDKAHRKGVTHRDLKPGNVMLTKSGTKLLDFGLAKLKQEMAPAAGAQLSQLPTMNDALTAQGTIVGTLQYMAPEQLEGKEADARTDIFAFGVVAYEMATGKRAFDGQSQASVISAIMTSQPAPISSLQPMTPPALERVVKRCLEKEPDERCQSAKDLTDELKWIAEGGSQAGLAAPVVARRRSRERIAWALAAAGLLLAAALAFLFARIYLNQPKPSVTRLLILPPENVIWWAGTLGRSVGRGPISLSPDGRLLAFVGASQDGRRQLWLRPLDNVTAHPLPGTDGAVYPFWSPDSRYLGFFTSGGLKKIDVAGGPPQTLYDGRSVGGGSWNSDGAIIFGSADGLLKISQAGGAPSPITTLDRSQGDVEHYSPWFLPDGRHFLYAALRETVSRERWVCAGSLDSKDTKCLFQAGSPAFYAPPGYLLYWRADSDALMAQPFDAQHLVITGDAFPIADPAQHASVSANGILAYIPGASGERELQWFDRSGKVLGTVGQPALYSNPVFSPDGTRVAVDLQDAGAGTRDLWVLDLKRGTASRFTSDPGDKYNPVWSRDGSQILFSSSQNGIPDIYQKAASGLGDSQVVFESKDQQKYINDLSPDGRYVAYDTGGAELWILPLFGDHKPFPFVQGGYSSREARFSPDGRYIAYASSETGDNEIYVQTFPEHTGKWQISTGGGINPEWGRDGKELYFLSGTKLMAVNVNTAGPQFEAAIPKLLFAAPFPVGGVEHALYRVTADGQRFLAVTTTGAQQANSPITVVTNWTADLKP